MLGPLYWIYLRKSGHSWGSIMRIIVRDFLIIVFITIILAIIIKLSLNK